MSATPHASKIETLRKLQAAGATQDMEAFLSVFAEDVVYHYHVGSRPLIGREWVRKFLAKYWANHTKTSWVIEHHAECGDRLLTEGREVYTNADGVEVSHPYMGIIEFREGKIVAWRDYFQMADPNAAK